MLQETAKFAARIDGRMTAPGSPLPAAVDVVDVYDGLDDCGDFGDGNLDDAEDGLVDVLDAGHGGLHVPYVDQLGSVVETVCAKSVVKAVVVDVMVSAAVAVVQEACHGASQDRCQDHELRGARRQG